MHSKLAKLEFANYWHSEMKRKRAFLLHFSRFFVTLPSEMAKLLRLGKKRNEFLCFALDFS